MAKAGQQSVDGTGQLSPHTTRMAMFRRTKLLRTTIRRKNLRRPIRRRMTLRKVTLGRTTPRRMTFSELSNVTGELLDDRPLLTWALYYNLEACLMEA